MALVTAGLLHGACGHDGPATSPTPDAAPDVAAEDARDAAIADAPAEHAGDASDGPGPSDAADAAPDAAPDVTPDATPDAAPDATPDAPDAMPEVAPRDAGPPGPAPDWTWLAPLPQSDPVVRLFVHDGALFAFTNSWTLWRSTDEGATWSIWSSISTQLGNDTPGLAMDISVGADGTFWAVGRYHTMARSTDGGRVFQRIFPGTGYGDFWVVCGVSAQVVLAGGPQLGLLRSADGGATFTTVIQSTLGTNDPSSLWTDGTDIWLGTQYGSIQRSTDGGLTWQGRGGRTAVSIGRFAGAGHERFAATSLGLYQSADDGNTWSAAATDGGASAVITDLAVAGDGVWAFGPQGVALRRAPGDSVFAPVSGAPTGSITAAVTTPGGAALAAGLGGQLFILHGGAATTIVPATTFTVTDLAWTAPGHLVAVTTAGKLLRSADGGKTFTSTSPATGAIRGLALGAADEMYLAGDGALLLRSTNGGDTFTKLTIPTLVSPHDFGRIWADASGRVFLRESGVDTIHASNDHGQTWMDRHVTDISGGRRGGVWADGTGTVWATAANGVYKSTDWGATFTGSTYLTVAALAVWGASPQELYFTTESGSIGHTTDGGASWTQLQSLGGPAAAGALNAIWSASPGEVFIAAGSGAVVRSNDHGATWLREATTFGSGLTAITGSAAGEIAASGSYGAILLRK